MTRGGLIFSIVSLGAIRRVRGQKQALLQNFDLEYGFEWQPSCGPHCVIGSSKPDWWLTWQDREMSLSVIRGFRGISNPFKLYSLPLWSKSIAESSDDNLVQRLKHS